MKNIGKEMKMIIFFNKQKKLKINEMNRLHAIMSFWKFMWKIGACGFIFCFIRYNHSLQVKKKILFDEPKLQIFSVLRETVMKNNWFCQTFFFRIGL